MYIDYYHFTKTCFIILYYDWLLNLIHVCTFLLLKSNPLFSIIQKYVRMRVLTRERFSWILWLRRRIARLGERNTMESESYFRDGFLSNERRSDDTEANDLVNGELPTTWQLDRRDATRSDVITWRKVRNAGRQVCARQTVMVHLERGEPLNDISWREFDKG